ncbi:MAG TPA: aldehyde dehydrogenase family protein, partial [Bryobacteraceae bacterium]
MSDVSIDIFNPATGEQIGCVPDSDSCDVDRAVAAARESFNKKAWRGMDPSKRERILWNVG